MSERITGWAKHYIIDDINTNYMCILTSVIFKRETIGVEPYKTIYHHWKTSKLLLESFYGKNLIAWIQIQVIKISSFFYYHKFQGSYYYMHISIHTCV